MVVVLPEPLGPRKPKMSPRGHAKLDVVHGGEVAEAPGQPLGHYREARRARPRGHSIAAASGGPCARMSEMNASSMRGRVHAQCRRRRSRRRPAPLRRRRGVRAHRRRAGAAARRRPAPRARRPCRRRRRGPPSGPPCAARSSGRRSRSRMRAGRVADDAATVVHQPHPRAALGLVHVGRADHDGDAVADAGRRGSPRTRGATPGRRRWSARRAGAPSGVWMSVQASPSFFCMPPDRCAGAAVRNSARRAKPQQALDPLAALGAAHAEEVGVEVQVLHAPQVAVQREALGHVADGAADALRRRGRRRARAPPACPRVGVSSGRQHAQRRRLAGAVRPDQAEDLPALHGRSSRSTARTCPYRFVSWCVSIMLCLLTAVYPPPCRPSQKAVALSVAWVKRPGPRSGSARRPSHPRKRVSSLPPQHREAGPLDSRLTLHLHQGTGRGNDDG